MATQLYFSRDTKCYIEFKDVVWEMPILDGFSFSQANNTSEISLTEMESSGGVSRRGRRAFNDSLAAGEWSFSTYVRPFQAAGATLGTGSADTAAKVHAVEEVLWAMMAGSDTYTAGAAFTRTASAVSGPVITPASSESDVTFAESNRSTFQTANIYFVMGDANRTVIKLKDAVVNEASVDFEIDGIATINWSGQCSEVVDFSGSTIEDTVQPIHTDVTRDGGTIVDGDVWLKSNDNYRLYVITNATNGNEASTTYVNEALTDTDNFIRNRLTQLSINGANTTGLLSGADAYKLTLTGGNITISNNVTYITPEELGAVNVPIGHVTGGRAVSGSFTCYLALDTTAMDGTGDLSRDFFEDLRGLTTTVTNSVDLTFKIGGGSGRRLELNFPTAHVEIPTHSIEDVISLETNFMALPSTIDGTNEVSITYKV